MSQYDDRIVAVNKTKQKNKMAIYRNSGTKTKMLMWRTMIHGDYMGTEINNTVWI